MIAALLALVFGGFWSNAEADGIRPRVGQIIQSFNGFDSQAACLTQSDLSRFEDANSTCATSFGTAEECKITQALIRSGQCRSSTETFRVISVDPANDLIQISPTSDPSKIYWARPDTFKIAK